MSYTSNIQQARIEQLARNILSITDDLKGNVEAKDFVNFPLALFFYRFISENLTHYINKQEQKFDSSFDYTKMTDTDAWGYRNYIEVKKGFFIYPSELFANVFDRMKNNGREPLPNWFTSYYLTQIEPQLKRFYKKHGMHVYTNIYTAKEYGRKRKKRKTGLDYGNIILDIFEGLFLSLYSSGSKLRFYRVFNCYNYNPDYHHINFNSPELGKTVATRNKKIIQIMDAVAGIPLNEFIEETSEEWVDVSLERQAEIWKAIKKRL